MCHLQRTTLALEDAINLAIEYMGQYVNIEEPGEVELFNDFGATTLAEATAQLLVGMATAGKLSDETLFHEMQRRGIISSDVDYKEEQDRISTQGPQPGSLEFEQALNGMGETGADGKPAGGDNPWAGMSGANLKGGSRKTVKG
jgi:hypothetical protein